MGVAATGIDDKTALTVLGYAAAGFMLSRLRERFRQLPSRLVGLFLLFISVTLYTDSLFSGSESGNKTLVLVDLHVVLLRSVFLMSFWNLLLAAVAWSSFWPSFSLQRSCQLHGLIRWDSQVVCKPRAGYKM